MVEPGRQVLRDRFKWQPYSLIVVSNGHLFPKLSAVASIRQPELRGRTEASYPCLAHLPFCSSSHTLAHLVKRVSHIIYTPGSFQVKKLSETIFQAHTVNVRKPF